MRFTQWSSWRATVPTLVLMFSGTVAVAQQHEHEGNQTAPAGTHDQEEAAHHAHESAESGEQHDHGIQQIGETEIFLVEGLRVDPEYPPGGSAVGRAGVRLPGGGYLHVVYGKPYKRAREIFGEVVKYDEVWVTGAHLSTELAVTVPVTIAGKHLEPGVYSLFTTPRRDRWTLHINEALGTHLVSEYDPEHDVVAVDGVPSILEEPAQAFVIEFLPAEGGVDLQIRWDRTAVAFPIRAH